MLKEIMKKSHRYIVGCLKERLLIEEKWNVR